MSKRKIEIMIGKNALIQINADSYEQDDDFLVLIKHVFLIRKIKVAWILKNQIEKVKGLSIFMKDINDKENICYFPIYAKRLN